MNQQLYSSNAVPAAFTAETAYLTMGGIVVNAPAGIYQPQGIVFDGTLVLATSTGTTSFTVALRRGGTGVNGLLVDSQIWTPPATSLTNAGAPYSVTLVDPNPPTNQAAVTSGGGALPTALQSGVQGYPVTPLTYFLTIAAAGAVVQPAQARIVAGLVTQAQ